MTISEAFEEYRNDCILFPNQAAKTEEQHVYAMRSLVKCVQDIPIEELTFDKVRKWKQRLEARGLAANSIRGYIVKLRVVLRYCRKKNMLVLDPELIPVPKRETKKVSFISPEEVQRLIDACEIPGAKHINRARNRAIVALLFSSGVRVGELCKLDRDDVKDNFFSVVGKGEVLAPSFIDETARKHIDEYLDKRKDHNRALFVSDQRGYPRMTPGGVREVFKTLKKYTGLKVRPHVMRHSFATDLMRNGADIRYVQQLMHHKNIETTAQYLHVVDSELHTLHSRFHSDLSTAKVSEIGTPLIDQ